MFVDESLSWKYHHLIQALRFNGKTTLSILVPQFLYICKSNIHISASFVECVLSVLLGYGVVGSWPVLCYIYAKKWTNDRLFVPLVDLWPANCCISVKCFITVNLHNFTTLTEHHHPYKVANNSVWSIVMPWRSSKTYTWTITQTLSITHTYL